MVQLRLSSFYSLLLSIFLLSCSGGEEKKDQESIKYSKEVAQIISRVTTGSISANSAIVVTFVDDVVSDKELNQEVKNPFSFKPSIDGSAKWLKKNVLVFYPDARLQERKNYYGKVDLTLIPKKYNVETFDLKFYVGGQSIQSFKASLELQQGDNPKLLVYLGEISFEQKIKAEAVKKAVSFSDFAINWNQVNGRRVSFVSEPIERASDAKQYTFRIDKDILALEESFERIVEVVPLQKLKLVNVEKDEQGKKPKMTLTFSDILNASQSLDGFISIEPSIDFQIQKLGKFVTLEGDFKFGSSYQVTVAKGVKSKWNTSSEKEFSQKVSFADVLPQVEFSSGGMFLPTTNNKCLQFVTINLERVHVEVKKVFSTNVVDFFRNETLKSSSTRNTEFNNGYETSVGAIVYNETLEIGGEKNEWLIHNLALDNVLSQYDNGLYLIRLNFNPTDALTSLSEDKLAYIQNKGQIYKPVTISDIGMIVKDFGNDLMEVYTTDLKTGQPMSGVEVTVTNGYRDGDREMTDKNGKALVHGFGYNYVMARKNGQMSVIKGREMKWNTSGFDVGGISSSDLRTRGYIYTERGVYRPGDSINLSCIVRYQHQSNVNAPATFKLYNPEGTFVMEQQQTKVKDDFYSFPFATNQNDPTGNWNVQVSVGNKYFYHNLKIETVVANKLKVKVIPDKKTVLPENKTLPIDVESRYLFGTPAADLNYETEVEIFEQSNPFRKYKDYNFSNLFIEFNTISSKIESGKLDGNGLSHIDWNVPKLHRAPAPLKAKISATVQENGGRPNHAWTFIDIYPFTHYVGIKNGIDYLKFNANNDIPVVVVDHQGKAVSGRKLNYKIYKNDSYWWYQYNSLRNFRLKYKSDKHSYLVEEGTIISSAPYGALPFRPTQRGQYLIEISDAKVNGHTSSIFTSAYPYGAIPTGDINAGTFALRSTKESYEVGEEAVISFPSPKQGNILMTVEKGDKVLVSKWIEPSEKDEMKVRLKISENMTPNVYVTITALQQHSQTVNDRPLRVFGILPLNVVDPKTKQELIIDMADELKPKAPFDVNIRTVDGEATQFTVAVVDEGLLDLTNFKTPNAWSTFFKKIRLEVDTYDLFGHVIGANEGDVFKTFSIGGDEDYRQSQLNPFAMKKRFKPISMFKGPLMTDDEGRATVRFDMPNYVGSVRVMVLTATGNTYGSEEKAVPVKSDLIVQSTLPRALKPNDEFEIPVNVFATKDNIGEVDIKLTIEGPLEIIGKSSLKHYFKSTDDQLFKFRLKVKSAIGQSKIKVTCSGKNTQSIYEADIPVSASAARVYQQTEKLIKSGESIALAIPKIGIDGTNTARLQLSTFPNLDFMNRLDYLIRYPYGCLEQTTSSVFPQLVLKDFFAEDAEKLNEIDENINAGIERLRMFQLSDGGFSYWQGGDKASTWGSNYAGEFLIEARKRGYVVPDVMYDGIVKYLKRQARYPDKKDYYRMSRVNRCFILSQTEHVPFQEMNLLKQNSYDKMSNVEKYQLVTAYTLAGAADKVSGLMDGLKTEVDDYTEFAHTYGSSNRDLGIILKCLVLLDQKEDARLLAEKIAKTLSSREWYSTQTVGQMLLGIGNYFDYASINVSQDVFIQGLVKLPNGKSINMNSKNKFSLRIDEGFGEQVNVSLDAAAVSKELYASISASGVPLVDNTKEENSNIAMSVEWFDEDGQKVDLTAIEQGTTFYGHFEIRNESVVSNIEEMALVQLLPSGWEIENTRLSNESLPEWMNGYNIGEEEYLDIRDDRIMWFFDLDKKPLDFVVKINAITKGKYQLPGARCEAMYNNDYIATKAAKTVEVLSQD